MGIGGSRQDAIREHVQDPELIKQLAQLQETNSDVAVQFDKLMEKIRGQDLLSKIESFGDLKRFDEEAAVALVTLAKKTEALKMEGQNFGFFGLTSTGKSSIINTLIENEVAEIGAGDTTTKVAPYKGTTYTLHDIPGRNDEMSYFSMEYISFWKGLTGRLVVITATLKEMTKVFTLLDAIDLQYDIVVNKLDYLAEEEHESFKKKIRKEVETFGLKGVKEIWFISAKYPDQFDCQKMVNHLATN